MPLIQTEEKSGEPWQVGNYEITPTNWVLKIRIPGVPGGLIWNRPKSVTVRSDDGQEKVLPVIDVTRVVIWAMLGGGLLGAIMMGMMSGRKRT